MTDVKATASRLDKIAGALRPFAALDGLARAKVAPSPKIVLDALRAVSDAVAGSKWINAAIEDVEAEIATRMTEIEADIHDLAARRGWRLEGGWPTYQIERGVELRVEPRAGIVRVAGVGIDATDLAAVEAAIAEAARDLVPRKFSPHEMLEQLQSAHMALAAGSSQVPVLDLYGRYVMDRQTARFWRDAKAERFVPLSVDQFRARLSQMLEAGVTVARDGRELRLLPPLDPKDALFVYQPAEGRFGYVGRIEFVGDRDGDRR